MNLRELEELEHGATAISPQVRPEAGAGVGYTIRVIEGPECGASLELDETGAALVGQSPVCQLRLSDPEVSRRHLAVDVVEGLLRIRDLDSTNGTRVGELDVVEARLRGGEIVRVGATRLSIERRGLCARAASSPQRFGRVVGESASLVRLYPLLERLAHSTVPVVIEGETGTGKELVAESLHELGPRASGPYVVFDCTAVPPSLVESELFGHERGAFTGAEQAHAGLFEQADGGTLLIDEIGELDAVLQPKLLRAIERSQVRRIGGTRWTSVDVRVIAATRRDLDYEVQRGRFRDDLFHRLAVARVELPPLRARKGDVALLARHFWADLGGASSGPPAELIERWEDQRWPGNVRELRNAVARHIIVTGVEPASVSESEPTSSAPLPSPTENDDYIANIVDKRLPFPIARMRVMEEFQRRYLERVLDDNEQNVRRAAAASGIGRRYFQVLRKRTER